MTESRWKGYIKDYNGSTMMQCSIDRNIKHETLYQDIRRQKDVSLFEFKFSLLAYITNDLRWKALHVKVLAWVTI